MANEAEKFSDPTVDMGNGEWRNWRRFVIDKLETSEKNQIEMKDDLKQFKEEIRKKFDAQGTICRSNMVTCPKLYVGNRLFFWLIGILIFSWIGLAGYVSVLNSNYTEQRVRLEMHEKYFKTFEKK